MSSLNKAILIGRVGRDPETRYSADGKAIANLSIATTQTWKDKSGDKQESTEWHRISAFGKLAEIINEYVKKGSLVYIEGKITTRKWQDKGGVDKYTTEIIADQMQMLGGKSEGKEDPRKKQAGDDDTAPRGKSMSDIEDDIPFN